MYVCMYGVCVYVCMYVCMYIGTIGHVAHGKSTVVKAISGVQVYRLCVCVCVCVCVCCSRNLFNQDIIGSD